MTSPGREQAERVAVVRRITNCSEVGVVEGRAVRAGARLGTLGVLGGVGADQRS